MKLTIHSGTLLSNLQIAAAAISSNTIIPILQNFLFTVKGDELEIRTSDLETMILVNIHVTAETDGSYAVPSKILIDFLKTLRDEPITIEVLENGQMEIKGGGRGKYKFMTESAEEFPAKEDVPETKTKIPGEQLLQMIKWGESAVSNDELRPQMTGYYFDFHSNSLNLVSTDAHTLVQSVVKGNDLDANFIVPQKAMNFLKNTIENDLKSEVEISWGEKRVFFKCGEVSIDSRLIVGTYPDYNTVIPSNNPNTLHVDTEDLIAAIKRVMLFASKSTFQIILNIAAEKISLLAQDLDYSNEAQEEMACEYEGEEIQIAFNAKYLMACFKALGTTQARITMSHPARAALIFPVDGGDVKFLIMPLMINV